MATGGTNRIVKGLGEGEMQWIAPFQLVDENGTEMFGVTSAGTVTGVAISAMASGTVGAPGLSFSADTDTGLYRIGANNAGVAANGAKVPDIGTSGLGVVGVALIGDGAVTAPAVSFTSDPDSGMYRIGANNLGVAAAGAKVLDVSATGLGVVGTALVGDGSAAAPSVGFSADTDNGLYRIGANNIGLSIAGTKVVDFAAASSTFTGALVRASQKRLMGSDAKVGATAGWAVNAATNVGRMATCPASQTGSTLVIPLAGLKVGDTITAYGLIGQIESAGNVATLDASIRSVQAAAADLTDAAEGAAMTQLSVTADTAVTSANAEKASQTIAVAADKFYYMLVTATTAASTDIDLAGVYIVVTES